MLASSCGGAVLARPVANILMAYASNLPVDETRPAGQGASQTTLFHRSV